MNFQKKKKKKKKPITMKMGEIQGDGVIILVIAVHPFFLIIFFRIKKDFH